MKCEKCGHNLRVFRLGRRDCTCECHNDEMNYKPTPKRTPLNYIAFARQTIKNRSK